MARDIQNQVNHLQEHTMPEGKELEISLLGPSVASKYNAKKSHSGLAEDEIEDITVAAGIVKKEINDLEKKGEAAEENSHEFKFDGITTRPETPYVYGLFTELCRLLDYDDLDSKNLRYYDTLDTILDKRFGTDFLLEIDPAALLESKFGKEVKNLSGKMNITVDITKNLSKSMHKADIVLQYENLPTNEGKEERIAWGKQAAPRILKILVEKIQKNFSYNYKPPILEEIKKMEEAEEIKKIQDREKSKHKGTVEQIRKGVVKRVKNANPNV